MTELSHDNLEGTETNVETRYVKEESGTATKAQGGNLSAYRCRDLVELRHVHSGVGVVIFCP